MKRLLSVACLGAVLWTWPFMLRGHGASAQNARATAPPGTVVIELVNVQNGRGQLLAALFRERRGFPADGAKAFARRVVKAHKGVVRLSFTAVPPGPFVISVHHDEDADFELDTGLFGIPTEGYGFSRNAHAPFGPPSFDDCKLSLQAGQQQLLRIRIRY